MLIRILIGLWVQVFMVITLFCPRTPTPQKKKKVRKLTQFT